MINFKAKVDEYFGVEGSLHDQLWFYGMNGFILFVGLGSVIIANL